MSAASQSLQLPQTQSYDRAHSGTYIPMSPDINHRTSQCGLNFSFDDSVLNNIIDAHAQTMLKSVAVNSPSSTSEGNGDDRDMIPVISLDHAMNIPKEQFMKLQSVGQTVNHVNHVNHVNRINHINIDNIKKSSKLKKIGQNFLPFHPTRELGLSSKTIAHDTPCSKLLVRADLESLEKNSPEIQDLFQNLYYYLYFLDTSHRYTVNQHYLADLFRTRDREAQIMAITHSDSEEEEDARNESGERGSGKNQDDSNLINENKQSQQNEQHPKEEPVVGILLSMKNFLGKKKHRTDPRPPSTTPLPLPLPLSLPPNPNTPMPNTSTENPTQTRQFTQQNNATPQGPQPLSNDPSVSITTTTTTALLTVTEIDKSMTFNTVLTHPSLLHYFSEMAKAEKSDEALLFFKDSLLLYGLYCDICHLREVELKEWYKLNRLHERPRGMSLLLFHLTNYFWCLAAALFEIYVIEGSPHQVNLSSKISKNIEQSLCKFANQNQLLNIQINEIATDVAIAVENYEYHKRLSNLRQKIEENKMLEMAQSNAESSKQTNLMDYLAPQSAQDEYQQLTNDMNDEQLDLLEHEAEKIFILQNVDIIFDDVLGQYIEDIMDTYLSAATEVHSLLQRDTYTRFKQSKLYQVMLKDILQQRLYLTFHEFNSNSNSNSSMKKFSHDRLIAIPLREKNVTFFKNLIFKHKTACEIILSSINRQLGTTPRVANILTGPKSSQKRTTPVGSPMSTRNQAKAVSPKKRPTTPTFKSPNLDPTIPHSPSLSSSGRNAAFGKFFGDGNTKSLNETVHSTSIRTPALPPRLFSGQSPRLTRDNDLGMNNSFHVGQKSNEDFPETNKTIKKISKSFFTPNLAHLTGPFHAPQLSPILSSPSLSVNSLSSPALTINAPSGPQNNKQNPLNSPNLDSTSKTSQKSTHPRIKRKSGVGFFNDGRLPASESPISSPYVRPVYSSTTVITQRVELHSKFHQNSQHSGQNDNYDDSSHESNNSNVLLSPVGGFNSLNKSFSKTHSHDLSKSRFSLQSSLHSPSNNVQETALSGSPMSKSYVFIDESVEVSVNQRFPDNLTKLVSCGGLTLPSRQTSSKPAIFDDEELATGNLKQNNPEMELLKKKIQLNQEKNAEKSTPKNDPQSNQLNRSTSLITPSATQLAAAQSQGGFSKLHYIRKSRIIEYNDDDDGDWDFASINQPNFSCQYDDGGEIDDEKNGKKCTKSPQISPTLSMESYIADFSLTPQKIKPLTPVLSTKGMMDKMGDIDVGDDRSARLGHFNDSSAAVGNAYYVDIKNQSLEINVMNNTVSFGTTDQGSSFGQDEKNGQNGKSFQSIISENTTTISPTNELQRNSFSLQLHKPSYIFSTDGLDTNDISESLLRFTTIGETRRAKNGKTNIENNPPVGSDYLDVKQNIRSLLASFEELNLQDEKIYSKTYNTAPVVGLAPLPTLSPSVSPVSPQNEQNIPQLSLPGLESHDEPKTSLKIDIFSNDIYPSSPLVLAPLTPIKGQDRGSVWSNDGFNNARNMTCPTPIIPDPNTPVCIKSPTLQAKHPLTLTLTHTSPRITQSDQPPQSSLPMNNDTARHNHCKIGDQYCANPFVTPTPMTNSFFRNQGNLGGSGQNSSIKTPTGTAKGQSLLQYAITPMFMSNAGLSKRNFGQNDQNEQAIQSNHRQNVGFVATSTPKPLFSTRHQNVIPLFSPRNPLTSRSLRPSSGAIGLTRVVGSNNQNNATINSQASSFKTSMGLTSLQESPHYIDKWNDFKLNFVKTYQGR
jgi:hypothetical protein